MAGATNNGAAKMYTGAQRRQHFRVPVGHPTTLQVRVWSIAPGDSLLPRPLPSHELQVEVTEVSQGGLTLSVAPPRGKTLEDGGRLRVEITMGHEPILLEGRLRLHHGDGGSAPVRAGVQFVLRKSDRAGREAAGEIPHIVSAVQRESLKSRQSA